MFVDSLEPRSAANLVSWTAGLEARIKVRAGDQETAFVCDPPSPGAFLRLVALGGVRPGERIEITAEGPDAEEAIRRAEKASTREEPPQVEAELERALR